MSSESIQLKRIAEAAERIANALETKPSQIVLRIDGRTISQLIMKETLRTAARGATTLVGGSLVTGKKPDGNN